MRRRFFVENFENESAVLCGETAEHLGRVLRAGPGQLYELSDGKKVWLARIERVTLPKHGESRIDFVLIEPIAARAPRLALHLLISIVKFDRFEWCIEKATELGANEIVPMAAARSDKPLVKAAARRRARWQKILAESAQQARRLGAPVLRETTRPAEAFDRTQASLKILLSERAGAPGVREIAGTGGARLASVAIAIGPEGGWTDAELSAARSCGFCEASLGEHILRTETAVIAAASVVRFALE